MNCRSCLSSDLEGVLDLGEQRLSDFRNDNSIPPSFPLELLRCRVCSLVQLSTTVPPHLLYHSRYSFKSGVSEVIREDLANVVHDGLVWTKGERWLDIASNDGTLLSYVPKHYWREGVDPLVQFSSAARKHADRITVNFFHPESFSQRFDIITSVSMFYDIDDPNTFVAGVKSVLADDGVWIIQQNYLPTMLRQNSIDNVSHEHLAYYSLQSFEALLGRHGLEVNHVTLHSVNGGCFRTVVSRIGSHLTLGSVLEAREAETHTPTWGSFAATTKHLLFRLCNFVKGINAQGGKVYVYGASTRGGTIWQAAGLDRHDLPYVVDRNPAKVGKIMSSIGAPIISEEQARVDKPDYMLVGPWWFRDQFIQREKEYLAAGGKLIFPLPYMEIVGG